MKLPLAAEVNIIGDPQPIELTSLISPDHPMVRLADQIDWHRLDTAFGTTYGDRGRPGISTPLMVALHYLKYTFDLSDEEAISAWVENPYWQYLSGMSHFEHHPYPSSMSRWRRRVGESGAEGLLSETVQTGLHLSLIRRADPACECRYYCSGETDPLPHRRQTLQSNARETR